MEILMKANTCLSETSIKIHVSDVEFVDSTPEEIKLECLDSKHVFARVTVDVKILKVGEFDIGSTGKEKKGVVIADHSKMAKMTLWEKHIGSLQEQASYRCENVVVREWSRTKYLSITKESRIVPRADIKDAKTVEDGYQMLVLWQYHSLIAFKIQG